jgi:hypothetical protein
MAVVILGGLVTSTLVGLVVMPALYARFGSALQPSATSELELLHRWAGVEPEAVAAAEERRVPEGQDDTTQLSGHVGAGVDAEEAK